MDKKSILLVDDEDIILHAIGMDLRKENYDVTLATSGEEAVDLLRKGKFNLVITDLSMSGIGGIQVLEETKNLNYLTGVFILTGFGDMNSAINALRKGADDYLLKPCDFDELILRIERYFERQMAFEKVKVYEKILPICMYCKSFRDDSGVEPGMGKWMSMEVYLHSKSGISLSHGCCPECYKKHIID